MDTSSQIHRTDSWIHTPIIWSEEKKLIAITGVVLAILALGTVCYFYVGGKFTDIPGYNKAYAYGLWSFGGAIALGTTITYVTKAILSSRLHSKEKAHSSGPYQRSGYYQNHDFKQLSFEEALKSTAEIQWLTEPIKENIIQLSPDEFGIFSREDFYREEEQNLIPMLEIFEKKRSALVSGRQNDNQRWFIAARIQLQRVNGQVSNGMILITQNGLDGPGSTWWICCKIEGVTRAHMRREFYAIIFNDPDYPRSCKESLWVKEILEGKERGLLPWTAIYTFIESSEEGTVTLWIPPESTT